MSALSSTWPRRIGAVVLVLIAFGVAALSLYYSTRVAGQP